MRALFPALLFVIAALPSCAQSAAVAATHPRDKEIHDADTKAWWHTTEELANDGMEGRDTGSAAYQRAAEYVAARFKAAGLQPAGDGGGYFQSVPMRQVDVSSPEHGIWITSHEIRTSADSTLAATDYLHFLAEVTVAVPVPEQNQGELVFRGYCGKDAMQGVSGKIVICFGTQRAGLPTAAERLRNVKGAGGTGIISVDDPGFTIEPPRWPFAYARSVAIDDGAAHDAATPYLSMRISAEAFARVLRGSGHDAAAILKAGGARQPLESFDLPGFRLNAYFQGAEKKISSPNILALLPGSDPRLKDEIVVVSAHLDGYGYGTPVAGDNLYNGALDDAAYVALLIQMADDIKAGVLPRPKRSILFAAFTGEEKGLLGANWFVRHPTVPVASLAADINLDQLRPLFPLNILTMHAVNDSTLGETVKRVAKGMNIEIREDREPERGLLRRADHYPFLQIHVPATGFIFGYDPGTEAERRYREWYQVRYHRPQDDLTQPMDFDAAKKFDDFFYALTEAVANDAERPHMLPSSTFAAK